MGHRTITLGDSRQAVTLRHSRQHDFIRSRQHNTLRYEAETVTLGYGILTIIEHSRRDNYNRT